MVVMTVRYVFFFLVCIQPVYPNNGIYSFKLSIHGSLCIVEVCTAAGYLMMNRMTFPQKPNIGNLHRRNAHPTRTGASVG